MERRVLSLPFFWLFLLSVLLFCWPEATLLAADPEEDAFNSAAKAFNDGFFERAEQQLGDFIKRFPKAQRLAEATLLQGQALHQLKRYVGAVNVLGASLEGADKLKDQFLFWMGESE